MRTSRAIIQRVSYWLEIFTLAELVFVLNEDARISPFDKFRIAKIGSSVRHTFFSNQTDQVVKMLIDDLAVTYCQSRPVHKPTSLGSTIIRQNEYLLVPFRTSCRTCNRGLNTSDAIQKQLRLYCQNGSVVTGSMISLHCHHDTPSSSCSTNEEPVIIFPNFTRINKRNIYTHDSLHYGDYVYLGGDVAIERGVIEKYTAQIIQHDLSMMGTAASMNQEAINLGYPQLASVDRRSLTNVIHAYLIIQFDLSMGNASVSTPCSLAGFNQWAWEQFPRLLSYFTYLWTNHRTLIGSCGEHCSKCLVIDGHQKSRRRICAFKDVIVQTEEMKDLVIGCCKTPIRWSRYCETHNHLSSTTVNKKASSPVRKKRQIKKFFHLLSNNSHQRKDRLNATSCRTVKSRSDSYVKKCTRSFGIIALVTNCRIITSFSELYRSETLREIINLFATTIRVAGQLAPTCVYDDGCHLVRYIKNHIGQELTKTPAMVLLDATPISVDRSHFRNHVGEFCRRTMNPDKNPLLNGVNTEAAEQTFSWLKQYANIISNMNHLRCPLFMLILFHLKNLSRVKRSPAFVLDVVSLVPTVEGVSLSHSADSVMKTRLICSLDVSHPADMNPNGEVSFSYLKLPRTTTDWDAMVRNIVC